MYVPLLSHPSWGEFSGLATFSRFHRAMLDAKYHLPPFPWAVLKLQYFGHLRWRTDFTGKDPGAGKDWGQGAKGTTEDEVFGWCHQLNGREFEQALGNSEGHGHWCAAVRGAAKSQILLSNWTTRMDTDTGVLQSLGLQRVRYYWATEQHILQSKTNTKLGKLFVMIYPWNGILYTHFKES